MLNIKLYGKRTSGYSFVKEHLTEFLLFNNLEYDIVEINNVTDFIDDHINSIPCVTINDSFKIEVSKQESIKKAILQLYHGIIDIVGINSVKKIIIPFDYSKASINAFQQTKSFLKTNHCVIQLAFLPSLTINDEDACKIERIYTEEKMKSICEKLENDYIGDVANITPIYSQAVGRCQWPELFKNNSNVEGDIILYNFDSQLIPLDRVSLQNIFNGHKDTLIIYNTTKVSELKGVANWMQFGQKQLVEVTSDRSSYGHFSSAVDSLSDEPPIATFSKISTTLTFETMAYFDECLQNKIPMLILQTHS
jgi:hypothetical protein